MTSAVAPVLSTVNEFDKVTVRSRNTNDLVAEDEFVNIYYINELARHIKEHQHYKSVALQFPDYGLPDSARVVECLRTRINDPSVNTYILADTSYSPCCVDEVAARHVNADVVVHFGNTCLSRVTATPVVYVLSDGIMVDVDQLEEKFNQKYAGDAAGQYVLLVSDVQYAVWLDRLYERLKPKYPNVFVTSVCEEEQVDDPSSPSSSSSSPPKTTFFPPLPHIPSHTEISILPTRRHEPLPKDLSEYSIFFLTNDDPSPSLILHLSTLVASVNVLSLARPNAVSQARGSLQKRYRYMNMARTAGTIGILVNTLSLKSTNNVLRTVKTWITSAGKKYYTFVVGKPNVPKLANFDVIDIWVVLGCSLGGLIVDCEEFYKPIITPYELNLALKSEVEWTGKWPIDFDAILTMPSPASQDDENGLGDDFLDDAPQYDPVSGKYVSTSRPLRRHIEVAMDDEAAAKEEEGEKATGSSSERSLVEKFSGQLTIHGQVSTASEYLHNRTTWRGLGSDWETESVDSSEGALVKEGRSGIARGYRAPNTQDRS